MGHVTMRAHLQFGSYKLMYLLGIHSSLIQKNNNEFTIIIMSHCIPKLFSCILMYTLNPSKLYTIQHYKCIHNYISYKSNITDRPWTHLYRCNSKSLPYELMPFRSKLTACLICPIWIIISFSSKTYQSSNINLSPQNIVKSIKSIIMGYYNCNKP